MDNESPLTTSIDYAELLQKSEKEFVTYQSKCANVEKTYADLSGMTSKSSREMKIFWANLEVLRPIVYSRPPRPIVVSRHKDRKQVPTKTGEILQRVLEYEVESDGLHDTLLHVRDDLSLNARGVVWLSDDGSIEHVDRKDFRHDPARKWSEVGWVARRGYYTKKEGVDRFGKKFKSLTSTDKKSEQDPSNDGKIGVWEIWDKTEKQVVFFADGAGTEDILEVSEPLFDVEGFFPCPRPAYGTIEPGTLKPVPDIVYYRDQLDEINELTGRISALSKSLRMKGFYPSGVSEVGEAIEAAMRRTDNDAILIPVSNLASLGGSSLSQSIIWMPVREVAQTITDLIQLRRQLIQDVYEITGLSDIMRGSTMASETATAQNLKAQYGSVRVRERQSEMVRIARDAVALKAEIMAESVDIQDLLEIAQIDDIPTEQDIQNQIVQQNQMLAQQGQPPQYPDLSDVVTVETIQSLLQSQKTRPFILSIETDSTIQPNEEADKASRIEFISVMSQFLQQAVPAVTQAPVMAPLLVELIKFSANGFRAGRELSDVIDNFGDQIEEMAKQAQQPQEQQPDPQVQIEMQKAQQDAQTAQVELQIDVEKAKADIEKTKAETAKLVAEIERIKADTPFPSNLGGMV